MRMVEEIEEDISSCANGGSQQRLDELWLQWFRATAHDIKPDRLRELCAAEKGE